MSESARYTPVVIVGAARSGTNMLRDALVRFPGCATWDCDEINPVWRHGYFWRSDDELAPEDLKPAGMRAIRKAFAKVHTANPGARYVVEKTCANSLRLGYVDAALDDARFIQIVRDGRDVVPSALKRWRGEFEAGGHGYFIAKGLNSPLSDLPLYAAGFVGSRLRKLLGQTDRLDSWGPRYRGMDADMARPLDEICALQWAACVDRSDEYLETLPSERWLRLTYEDFVSDPVRHLGRIAAFIGVDVWSEALAAATSGITSRSVGKGLSKLDHPDRDRLEAIMRPTLLRHGYVGGAS